MTKYLVLFDNRCPYKNETLLTFLDIYDSLKTNPTNITHKEIKNILRKIKINFINYLLSKESKILFIKIYLKFCCYILLKIKRSTKYLVNTIKYLSNNGYSYYYIIQLLCNNSKNILSMYELKITRIYCILLLCIIDKYADLDYDTGDNLIYVLHCSKLSNIVFLNYDIIRYTLAIWYYLHEFSLTPDSIVLYKTRGTNIRIYRQTIRIIHKYISCVLNGHSAINKVRLYKNTAHKYIDPNSIRFLWCATIARINSKHFIFVYKKLN